MSKRKWAKGRLIETLDDLCRQQMIYWDPGCPRVRHIVHNGWFRGWQMQYAINQIANKSCYTVIPVNCQQKRKLKPGDKKADLNTYKQACWEYFKSLRSNPTVDDLSESYDAYVNFVVGKGVESCDLADFKKVWATITMCGNGGEE